MKISGAQMVAEQLKREGVNITFGLVGYYVSPIFAACDEYDIKILGTRHEQAAIHMADGYSQTSGKVGIAIISGGPGFANAVSAIIKAYMSQTPLLVIVGAFQPSNKDVGGLEDMDQLCLVKKYSQWTATVYDAKRIPEYIAIAMRHATCGCRGPVILEIPINYLLTECEKEDISWPCGLRTSALSYGDKHKIIDALKLIAKSKKPIMIVGDDIFYTNGKEILLKFVETVKIPIMTVNAARGIIPDCNIFCMGSGRTIEAGAQLNIYKEADLIFCLGCKLDYSLSFGKPPIFNQEQIFIQVDTDACNIGSSSRKIDVGIIGNTEAVLEQMLAMSNMFFGNNLWENWIIKCNVFKKNFRRDLSKVHTTDLVNPFLLLNTIKEIVDSNTIFVLDGSNAMLWACAVLECNDISGMVIGPNSTYGQMGSGLPLALGAKVANPEREVILYTGDGSFGFNLMEIDSAIRSDIKITIIVHNDAAWGFCKETQKIAFGESKCGFGTQLGITRFDRAVAALGGYGFYVDKNEQLGDTIKQALTMDKISCVNVVTNGIMAPGSDFINSSIVDVNKEEDV